MFDELIERLRFPGCHGAREFGFALLVHALIVACGAGAGAKPASYTAAGTAVWMMVSTAGVLTRVLWTIQAFTARNIPASWCASRPGANTSMRKEPSRAGCMAFSADTFTSRLSTVSERVFKYCAA